VSRSFSKAAKAGDCFGLPVRVQVVEDHVRRSTPRPLVLVAADAVEEVQDRILLVLRVARRSVDSRLPLCPDRRRVVLDRLQLATVDAVPFLVEVVRGRGEARRRFVLLLVPRLSQHRQGRPSEHGTG
jgi:hypothetical protein